MRKLLWIFVLLTPVASARADASGDAVKAAVAEFWAHPGFIVSDEAFTDVSSDQMRAVGRVIANNDARTGCVLRLFNTLDEKGRRANAKTIILRAAQENGINPKVLACMMQREQGLLTDQDVTQRQLDWAMGFAVCDGCALSDPNVRKHRGFANQVMGAAKALRAWIDQIDSTGHVTSGARKLQPGRTYQFGSHRVQIENAASAAMYTY
ncbi:MAG: hypothetical protein Q7J80_16870, partial [Anaerolineales bacterium]|nr:hypothetical protein [Anaerolineales bacterium]